VGSDETGHERESIGAVLGPTGAIGLPAVRTLSDEYRDVPDPADSERVPPPPRRGLIRRAVDRLTGRREPSAGGRP
jgi:hypothetical protein